MCYSCMIQRGYQGIKTSDIMSTCKQKNMQCFSLATLLCIFYFWMCLFQKERGRRRMIKAQFFMHQLKMFALCWFDVTCICFQQDLCLCWRPFPQMRCHSNYYLLICNCLLSLIGQHVITVIPLLSNCFLFINFIYNKG